MKDNNNTEIKVPYLINIQEAINRNIKKIDTDMPIAPDVNNELEILINLMGLSRLIEYNMRVAFEKIVKKYNLSHSNPNTFNELLILLKTYINEQEIIELLNCVRLISNGLVHSDFKKVYLNTKKAYDINEIMYQHSEFNPPIKMINTTITNNGLNIDISTGVATDNLGNTIPSKVLIPDGSNEIDIDFKYYYMTGTFIYTFDVLQKAYDISILFKEDQKSNKA